MEALGMVDAERTAIFRVVAAVLHLGNLEFTSLESLDDSVIQNQNGRFLRAVIRMDARRPFP